MHSRLHTLLIALAITAAPAAAQPLTTAFTYQGEIDQSGTPASGHFDLRFRLYDTASNGTQLGSTLCAPNLLLTSGRFTVALDFGAQFSGQQRFLEIELRPTTGLDCSNPAGFTTLSPRQPLTAAPFASYALTAGTALASTNASQLNGQSPSYYTNAANLTGTLPSAALSGPYAGAVNFTNTSNTFTGDGSALSSLNASSLNSGTIPAARLPVPLTLSGAPAGTALLSATNSSSTSSASAISALATSTTGATYALYAQNNSTTGTGVFGWVSATTGATTGVYGQSAGASGSGVQGAATASTGTTFGVQGSSASSAGTGVFGWATSIVGSAYGGHFRANSGTGAGVFGEAIAATGPSIGVLGQAVSSTGAAVLGQATSTSGANYGGKFTTASPGGLALYAESTSTTNGAITARLISNATGASRALYATATATTANADAIVADTASPYGTAVTGQAFATTGLNVGVSGSSEGNSGIGVSGATLSSTGTGYGVFGSAASGAAWGVFSQGRLAASGSKAFRIDHPSDPENKYLLHYCEEGPEVMNFYSGKVTLDSAGRAVVSLPDYFASINTDPRYTLTPVGAPMPMLHIAEEISDADLAAGAAANPGDPIPRCFFVIAGGVPRAKVSWRIDAVRNDRWLRRYGAPVETDKPASERGTYEHPELFNQPRSRTLNYHADAPATSRPDQTSRAQLPTP